MQNKTNLKIFALLMVLVMSINCMVFALEIEDEDILDPNALHTDNFTTEPNTDGSNTCTITGYTSKIYTNIIPGTINGKKVTRIAENAFKNMDQLSGEIIIPDSVISIGDGAFEGCTKVIRVVMGVNLTTIGNNAFSGCTSIETIQFNKRLQTIGDYAFEKCTDLTKTFYEIPTSVTKIGSYAFSQANISGLKFVSKTAPTITKTSFAGVVGLEIYTPKDGIHYTKEYNWPTTINSLLYGDVNSDGAVNVEDSARILDLFKYGGATEYEKKVGDLNNDGILNVEDAGKILDIYKGIM